MENIVIGLEVVVEKFFSRLFETFHKFLVSFARMSVATFERPDPILRSV